MNDMPFPNAPDGRSGSRTVRPSRLRRLKAGVAPQDEASGNTPRSGDWMQGETANPVRVSPLVDVPPSHPEVPARSAGLEGRTDIRPGGRTLRHPADLAAAGLVPETRVAALEEVAARYAVAITPAMAELIDAADPARPHRPPVRARPGRTRHAAGGKRRPDRRRCPRGHAGPDPPLSGPRAPQAGRRSAPSIAASASAARRSGLTPPHLPPEALDARARLHRRASRRSGR